MLVDVAIRTIQAIHDGLGLRNYRGRPEHLLIYIPCKKRFAFCKIYKVWSDDNLKTVLWTDKDTFFVTGRGSRVYRKPGSDIPFSLHLSNCTAPC